MHPWSIAFILQFSSLLTVGTSATKAVQPALAQCVVHPCAETRGSYVITLWPGDNAANTTGQLTILNAQHLPVRMLPVLFNGVAVTHIIRLQGLGAGKYYVHLSGGASTADDLEISVE